MSDKRYYQYSSRGRKEYAETVLLNSIPLSDAKKEWTVKIDSQKTAVELSKYKGKNKTVLVPAYVDGIPVTTLKSFSEDPQKIVSVIIPETVTAILSNAFAKHTALKSVILAETTIPTPYSFAKCDSLVDKNGCIVVGGVLHQCPQKGAVVISGGITKIPKRICYGEFSSTTYKITSVIIPEGVTVIEDEAFYGQNSLVIVKIPSTLKVIGRSAFEDCIKLTNMNFPAQLASIGDYAFRRCKCLTSKPTHPLSSIGVQAFSYCWELADDNGFVIVNSILFLHTLLKATHITIPEGVEKIDEDAFWYHENVQELFFPKTLKKIGSEHICSTFALPKCKGLADENGFVVIDGCVFDYYGDAKTIQIPDGVTAVHCGCFNYKSRKAQEAVHIVIPDSVKEVGRFSFGNVYLHFRGEAPVSIDGTAYEALPEDSYTNNAIIAGNTLISCNFSGDYYTVPDSVERIVSGAFINRIDNIVIPEGVKYLEPKILVCKNELLSVTIPESVEYIGGILQEVANYTPCITIISKKGSYAEKYAKVYGYKFTAVGEIKHAGIWKIKKHQDQTCELTEYYGKEKVVVIPSEAEGCCVTEIGRNLFYGHSEIEEVVIPDSVKVIGANAFYKCSLKMISLPNSIEKIKMDAFNDCGPVTNITIPASVIAIGVCSMQHFETVTILGNPKIALNGPVFRRDGVVYGHLGSTVDEYRRISWNQIQFQPLC